MNDKLSELLESCKTSLEEQFRRVLPECENAYEFDDETIWTVVEEHMPAYKTDFIPMITNSPELLSMTIDRIYAPLAGDDIATVLHKALYFYLAEELAEHLKQLQADAQGDSD